MKYMELVPPLEPQIHDEQPSSTLLDPFSSPESKARQSIESIPSPSSSVTKYRPKEIVRYEIVKYRVSPLARENKDSMGD